MKVAIIYGSTTGNTASVAEKLREQFASLGEVTLSTVGAGFGLAGDADLVVLGASTWGIGEMQEDWLGKEDLSGLDLSGKRVAVFGTGDQMGFGDSFVDAIGILADAAVKAGATLVGAWPTDGYDFGSSAAVQDGKFVGLPIDEDQQPDLTDQRIADWTAQIKQELAA
jgi:flavodoxin I